MALKTPGTSRATEDKAEAAALIVDKIRELGGVKIRNGAALAEFVEQFLVDNPGSVTQKWLDETALRSRRAVAFFGPDRELTSIRPRDVRQWLVKFSHLSNSNQRHHLYGLSSMYRYAQEMEIVPLGYNPSRRSTSTSVGSGTWSSWSGRRKSR